MRELAHNDCENYLIHYGILGMKWGVRRFETKSGHLTAAGKERYKTDTVAAKNKVAEAKVESKTATQNYYKAPYKDADEAKKEAIKAQGKVAYAKQKLGDEKVKEKLNAESGKKSKHRSKLEEKYKSEGMSDEEAEIAAYKRARTEKILAVMGGVAVAAAAAYVIKNHYDKNVDKLIKPGTLLQNLAGRDNKALGDVMYVSDNARDNHKYLGLYGNQIASMGKSVFRTKASTNEPLRLASEESARKVLEELMGSDQAFKNNFAQRLSYAFTRDGYTERQQKLFSKALDLLDEGKVDNTLYRAFNVLLPSHDPMSEATNKKFYDALTKKGYNAIMDVNDKYLSDYRSKSPTIIFNAASKLSINEISKLDTSEIENAFLDEYYMASARKLIEDNASIIALFGASAAAAKVGSSQSSKRAQNKIVNDYKSEHPNTKLSRTEILDNYYNY